jgi:hypothetical protein
MGSLQSLKSDQKQALLTGIILVIAAFLRIYQLGQECLWVDEVSSVDQALRPLPELFFRLHSRSAVLFFIALLGPDIRPGGVLAAFSVGDIGNSERIPDLPDRKEHI